MSASDKQPPGDDVDNIVAREVMVRDQIEQRGISDPRILQAMREVPRHHFVPPEWRYAAYRDRPLPIGANQTISQPYMVARLIECLGLPDGAHVLEIGTGTGYQAAVTSRIAAKVYSVEYIADLARQARDLLAQLNYHNVQITTGDGSSGLPDSAPYDGIMVAAAAPRPPYAMVDQLVDGGRLVVPVGDTQSQQLLVVTRHNQTFDSAYKERCRFVPLRGQAGWSVH